MYSIVYMKTITISDEIYDNLIRLKGYRTFDEVINSLIQKNVEKRVELLLDALEETGFEAELEEISKNMR